jgi:hypothetical protein
MFFLRAEGFSCSLDVLYGGQGMSKFQFFFQKQNLKKFPAVFFSSDFDHQNPRWLDPDPDSMNPDPQLC